MWVMLSQPKFCNDLLLFCCFFEVHLYFCVCQRKETLLVEYRKLGRGNKFVDKRIGERDATMSYDEKMAKRFALERQVKKTTSMT